MIFKKVAGEIHDVAKSKMEVIKMHYFAYRSLTMVLFSSKLYLCSQTITILILYMIILKEDMKNFPRVQNIFPSIFTPDQPLRR